MLSDTALSLSQNGGNVSLSLSVLVMMTALTLLPAVILSMTSFTRIIIVLAILRQAIGLPSTPSNQILIGISLFLSFFIMTPVLTEIHEKAVTPYLEEKIDAKTALAIAGKPMKHFMAQETRKNDLALFSEISGIPVADDEAQLSFSTLIPAFVTSELKTAFQIGFLLFIPFLIIDLVVASVLMAMGMMMLSPLVISLPFKIMLFVLVDGWTLILGTLASSFNTF